MTALLALDAEVGVDGGWQAIADRVNDAGEFVPMRDAAIQHLRLAAMPDGPSGSRASSYREAIAGGVLVGVATDIVRTATGGGGTRGHSEAGGPIASAHVTICGAAAQPLRARQVEATLRGRRPSGALIQLASETAGQEAQPFGSGTTLAPAVIAAVRDITQQALTASLL
jgi:CO/xanthine dehydrogenase FAD-binding subunit